METFYIEGKTYQGVPTILFSGIASAGIARMIARKLWLLPYHDLEYLKVYNSTDHKLIKTFTH